MLRGHVAALQGLDPAQSYTSSKMTYDLRRLRLRGLIQRLPHSHRYVVTPAGRRVALFFTKSYARVLRRGLARLDAPPPDNVPDPLVKAWQRLDRELDRFVEEAKLAA
jgi:DNA-binding MarR family transcriptional regulator